MHKSFWKDNLRKERVLEDLTINGNDIRKQVLRPTGRQYVHWMQDALGSKYRSVVALVSKGFHQRQKSLDCLSKY